MKVSIIIYYNKDRGWLDQAIESVHNQNYNGQIELIKSYNPDGNASQNLNEGIKNATGDLIKFLSEDDMLSPNCVKDSVQMFLDNPDIDFIHGNAINDFGSRKQVYIPKIKTPTFEQLRDTYSIIHGGSLMYKVEIFKKIGYFNEELSEAEELEFNLRCLQNGFKIGYCNKPLYIYRRHDNQKSLGKGIDQTARRIRIDNMRKAFM